MKHSFKMELGLQIVLSLSYISIPILGVTVAKDNHVENRLIIDVGRIPENFINDSNSMYFKLKRYIESIPEKQVRKMNTQPFMLYFETDLNKHSMEEFDRVAQLIKAIQKNIPKFYSSVYVNIRFSNATDLDSILYKDFHKLLKHLRNHESIIAGISIEDINSNKPCLSSRSRRYSEIIFRASGYMKAEFRSTILESKCGYVVEHNQLLCLSFSEDYKKPSFLIINVKLNRYENIVSSYGMFKNYMRNVGITLNNMQASINHQHNIVYYRITLFEEEKVNRPKNHKTNIIAQRYKNLLLKNIIQWIEDESEKEMDRIIVEYFDNYDEQDFYVSNRSIAEEIIPNIINLPQDGFNENKTSDILIRKAACSYLNTVKLSGYQSLLLDQGTFKELVVSSQKSNSICNKSILESWITFYTTFLTNATIKEIHNANTVGAKIVINSYDWFHRLNVPTIEQRESALNKTKQVIEEMLDSLENLSVTCKVRLQIETYKRSFESDGRPAVKMAEEIATTCGPIWNVSTSIIVLTKFEVGELIQESGGLLMKLLDEIEAARQIITTQSPGKKFILEIQVDQLTKQKFEWNRETLYCKPDVAVIWHGFEAVLVWAKINEMPIILSSIKNPEYYSNPIAWEQLVLIAERMQGLVERFPIFVRRTYNHSRVFGGWDSHTIPCITKSSFALNSKIKQLQFSHEFSGVTFNMNLRENGKTLNLREVQTILCFSLGKFSKVEITNLNDGNLNILYDALTDDEFIINLSRNEITKKRLYLELEVKEFSYTSRKILDEIVEALQNLEFIVNLHMSNDTFSKNNNIFEFLRNKGVQIGIFITDCIEFANTIFSEIIEDTDFHNIQKKYLNKFDYMVCNTESELADNSNDKNVQQYLDSHYYLKTVFNLIFPHLKEIIFRLNPILPKDPLSVNSENGLHFLADVNNYAQKYKTNYFIVSAVSPEKYSSGKMSWWQILNYTDLTYTGFFNELESKYTETEQWAPVMIWNKHDNDEFTIIDNYSSKLTWAFTGMAVVFVLFIILVASLARKVRRHNKLLSEEEVQEFLKGKKYDIDNPCLTDVDPNKTIFEALSYKKEYEMTPNDIKVDTKNILGFGQFGVVYSGTIESNKFVGSERIAVKMPRSGCTKETLKSMLSEVKVLCYVGEHVNLVRFIGCYTKNIGQGVLWIVTEQCVGGSLQSYLRKQKIAGNGRDILPDLVRLCREIACGMEFIAKQKVVHGDLSARNVLLNKYNICKIGDFGLSRKLYEYQTYVKQNEGPMPWRWMAYESLKQMEFSTKSDVWSYGVTVWEIFTLGDLPYPGVTWNATFMDELYNGNRLGKPCYATENIYDMMIKCWNLREEDRPTFSDLVAYFAALVPYNDVI